MTRNIANILNVYITGTSINLVLEEITEFIARKGNKRNQGTLKDKKSLVVFTPNPEFLVEASENPKFGETLNKGDINIPDGVGLVWAGRILGQPIAERVSGADLVEKLLEVGNEKGWRVGIAGARRGVQSEAEELTKRLQQKYHNVSFVNLDQICHSGLEPESIKIKYHIDSRIRGNDKSVNSKFSILDSKFDLVFACHGMVKQENWILENKEKIDAKVFMGIGGSLDFLAGFSKRAPVWMRSLGLEWLWRGLQKPGHFRRIWRATAVFGWLVVRERVKISNF